MTIWDVPAEPTNQFRFVERVIEVKDSFKDGVGMGNVTRILQQRWLLADLSTGLEPPTMHYEWRDVPLEKE